MISLSQGPSQKNSIFIHGDKKKGIPDKIKFFRQTITVETSPSAKNVNEVSDIRLEEENPPKKRLKIVATPPAPERSVYAPNAGIFNNNVPNDHLNEIPVIKVNKHSVSYIINKN